MRVDEFRRLIEEKGKIAACATVNPNVKTETEADGLILSYLHTLLEGDRYDLAAVLLWGKIRFDYGPAVVQAVFRGLSTHDKLMLQGSGSTSKSYSGIIWHFCDWLRDPDYTNIKIVSTTGGHSRANTYSTMTMLHRSAVIPLPGIVLNDYIGRDSKERNTGFSIVAIPDGDHSERLQGFHPIPREKAHPKFGNVSRIRVFMDEAEGIPVSALMGIENTLASIEKGKGIVKVTMAYNPKDPSSKINQLSAPDGGHEAVDIETGYNGKDEWDTPEGWHVIRLDAKKTENVKQRKVIFPGLQTYDGYMAYARKPTSPEYFAYGRAIYPPMGVIGIIIQPSFIDTCRGTFRFIGSTVTAGGFDSATEGRDDACLTLGRVGMADAFTHESGKVTEFKEPRFVAQVDQQFNVEKGPTRTVARSFRQSCKMAGVTPEWLGGDATGNGAPIIGVCNEPDFWCDNKILAVDFTKSATDSKIMEQDKAVPNEYLEGLTTEVWWALSRFMEFGYLAIAPTVPRDPLEQQLKGRRYVLAGKKYKVEQKDIYKARLGRSPDQADSLTIFLHTIRMRKKIMGSLTGSPRRSIDSPIPPLDPRDKITWMPEPKESPWY